MGFFIADNQNAARETGAVETVIKVMSVHINSPIMCKGGSLALRFISESGQEARRDIKEKGGVKILYEVLSVYDNDLSMLESCCMTIGAICSESF